jgi:isoaspartyl peptidase/L-asparaginase-like protein (Ntn-hydrolase superfamily)
MEYKGFTLQQAMDEVVHHKLVALGGEGGMIGVDNQVIPPWYSIAGACTGPLKAVQA